MSDHVIFTKDGLKQFSWDGDAQEYKQNIRNSAVTNLRSECRIEDGVTLADIFNAVENDPPLKNIISVYSWCWHIDDFHEQAKLPKEDFEDADILYLEICWIAEIQDYSDGNCFDIYTDFSGPGVNGERYSVSCSPMNKIAHLRVKLNNSVEIEKHHRKSKSEMIADKMSRSFSLLDVLDAIYDDISFYGGPEDNKKFLEKMEETMEDIKSGIVKTIPMEDIFPEDDG